MKIECSVKEFSFSGEGTLGEVAQQIVRLLKAAADLAEAEMEARRLRSGRPPGTRP